MKRLSLFLLGMILAGACTTPSRLVYSSGFSFANYDYIIISKSDPEKTHTSLYGMDVEFANLMERFNMNVSGEKEWAQLSPDNQRRTLRAKMSLVATTEESELAVLFDDDATGRTVASMTTVTGGDILENKGRRKVLDAVSRTLTTAIQRDRGLTVETSEIQ
jgi:hypothetical protein